MKEHMVSNGSVILHVDCKYDLLINVIYITYITAQKFGLCKVLFLLFWKSLMLIKVAFI